MALLIFIALAFSPAFSHAEPGDRAVTFVAEQAPSRGLRDVVMDKFHAMNAAENGIFQDDISALAAPYFPPGQSFREAQKVVQQQNLGRLQVFKGEHDAAEGTMYVTKFSLMIGTFSEVYVVLDLDFAGKNEGDMVLTKTIAFIRSSNM